MAAPEASPGVCQTKKIPYVGGYKSTPLRRCTRQQLFVRHTTPRCLDDVDSIDLMRTQGVG